MSAADTAKKSDTPSFQVEHEFYAVASMIFDLPGVLHDRPFTAPAGSLLANDTDPEGDTLTTLLAGEPAHGEVRLNPDGSFTYTPASGFTGGDSFAYYVQDGVDISESATVSLDVGNSAPMAAGDGYTLPHDRPFQGSDLLANDLDADGVNLTATLVGMPSHGTVTVVADGSFVYTPPLHYTGPDSFS
jgi:hypothetical protein